MSNSNHNRVAVATVLWTVRLTKRFNQNGSQSPATAGKRGYRSGFTLADMLVAIAVLALVVVFVSRLVTSAATITTLGHKRMDADAQARQLLDRMAVDFAQMVKRSDVNCYLKAGNTIASMNSGVDANDRIAFFSGNPGYYSQAGYNSNASLVAYRVNALSTSASFNRVERMGKGLALNGAYTNVIPLLFLDSATAPTTTIRSLWLAATTSTNNDSDYEVIGPNVFRLEYYFLTSVSPPALVAYPTSSFKDPALNWTTDNLINIKDVSAVVVAIAAIDSKSRLLLTTAQIATLKGKLIDFGNTSCTGCPALTQWQTVPGNLLSQWQTVLNTDSQIAGMPRPAIQGIRLYERYFYLNQ
jgi:type II secretory pathway component PulJ